MLINLLHNTTNHPSKFIIKHLVETNDDARKTYKFNSQLKIKTTIMVTIF